MNLSQIAFLASFVQLMHGTCAHLRTVQVRQLKDEQTMWKGSVATFELLDHDTATKCFAWTATDITGASHPVVYLKTTTVDSPAAAIKAYVMDLCHELAA